VSFRGAIFDVDGVLVDSPHEQAWRETLQGLMTNQWSSLRPLSTYSPEAFTPAVYHELMSGKPRESGALAALEHFQIPDPHSRVDEYSRQKQTKVVELIRAGQFHAYPDALRFLLAVKGAGIPIAAASSSKNAGLFLRQIRLDVFCAQRGLSYEFVHDGLTLLTVFDADISGRDFDQGKPHPMIFLTAAGELGVPPGSCFVVEDATSGVQAAKAGGMAALGVARLDDHALLTTAGADLVVDSLDSIAVDALAEGRLEIATMS
jgi:beta-phosphoglucomutase-like phosphatase (HAD superfamily)